MKKNAALAAFLLRRHAEVKRVKRRHVKRALSKMRPHRDNLAALIERWSADGNFNGTNSHAARTWAIMTAAALGFVVRESVVSASRETSRLASNHLERLSRVVEREFDADPIGVTDRGYELSPEHVAELQSSFVGNTRTGTYSRLLKVAGAVVLGAAVNEFADALGSSSSNEDVAAAVFAPIESRAEMYIVTESGIAYNRALLAHVAGLDYMKRWDTEGHGCPKICTPADGQIRPMGENFNMGDGDTTDFPPAHPRCDCSWIPWRREWMTAAEFDDLAA